MCTKANCWIKSTTSTHTYFQTNEVAVQRERERENIREENGHLWLWQFLHGGVSNSAIRRYGGRSCWLQRQPCPQSQLRRLEVRFFHDRYSKNSHYLCARSSFEVVGSSSDVFHLLSYNNYKQLTAKKVNEQKG